MRMPPAKSWFAVLTAIALPTLFAIEVEAEGIEPIAIREPLLAMSSTPNGDSGGATPSANSRFVLLTSAADDLVTNCHNGSILDLYIKDLSLGGVSLVSVTPDGQNGGNGDTYQGAVSSDGRYVVFESLASNLVTDDEDSALDYFLRDRVAGTTRRISTTELTPGTPTDFPLLSQPAIDSEGLRVAFVDGRDLFVFERETGLTTKLTRPLGGVTLPTARTFAPQFSEDGNRLAFSSTISDLVRPTGGGPMRPLQLYVYEFGRGNLSPTNLSQVRLTNSQLPNVPGGYPVSGYSLSADGRQIFVTLVPPANPSSNLGFGVYRLELDARTQEYLTPNLQLSRGSTLVLAAASQSSAVAFLVRQGTAAPSYTNGFFVWTPSGGLQLQTTLGNGQARSFLATPLDFSADGTRLLYSSTDTNLVAGLAGVRSRYFLRTVATGQDTLAIFDEAEAQNVVLLSDGSAIIFESAVPGLAALDWNQASDLFYRPTDGGGTALLTPRIEGLQSTTGSGASALADSAFGTDGRHVVFTSLANDLVPLDENNAADVFHRDRQSGPLRLVSVDLDGAASGNGPSGQPVISADGRYVAFVSAATNLVAGDTNGQPDVFRRDLTTGTTVLVSVPTAGTTEPGSVQEFAMSADGQRLVWNRREAVRDRILFRDLSIEAEAPTILAAAPQISAPTISRDGTTVSFVQAGRAAVYTVGPGALATLPQVESGAARSILSAGGDRVVVFELTGGPIAYRRNPDSSYSAEVLPNGSSPKRRAKDGVMSADWRWLAYSGILAEMSSLPERFFVFLRNLDSGLEEMISLSYLVGLGDGDSDQPSFSPDARYVVFRSAASDLVPEDNNGGPDLFLYDRITRVTRLLTRSASGAPWLARSYRGRFGADSSEIWAHSFAAELTPGDFNSAPDAFRLTVPPDLDADGLEDNWEQTNFGDLSQSGDGDFDHDLVSNADELLAGTLPKDAGSFLFAEVEAIVGEDVTVSWTAVPGKRYRVVATGPFFAESAVRWVPVSPLLTANGNVLQFHLPADTNTYARYYRLIVAD